MPTTRRPPRGARAALPRAARLAAATAAIAGAGTVWAGTALADQPVPSPWSAPAVIAGSMRQPPALPSAGAGFPQVTFAHGGPGVVFFAGGGLLLPGGPRNPVDMLFTLGAPILADTVGAATQLTPLRANLVVGYGRNSLLAAVLGVAANPRAALESGRVGGPLGSYQAIGQVGQSIVGLVANSRGDAAALLEGCRAPVAPARPCASHLAVVARRAGGRFSKPVPLAGGANAMPPALAISPQGDVLLAWAAGSGGHSLAYARIRSASGRVGPVQVLGAAGDQGRLAAAIGTRDRAAVGWGVGYHGIDGATSPATFRVALAGAGGRFAGRARVIDSWNAPGTFTDTAIDVGMTAAGKALVTWQGRSGASFAIDTARTSGTRIGARQVLSAPGADATLDSLAIGRGGAAVVLFSTGGAIGAAAAAPGQVFSAPELVAPSAGAYGANAAIDSLTGRAVAVWYTADGQSVGYSVRGPASR